MFRSPSRRIPAFNPNIPSRKKSLGQGMVEYAIIVGVIAVAAIGAFGSFGDVIEQQVAGMANEMAGGNATTQIAAAKKAAGKAETQAKSFNDLSTYSENGSGVDAE